MNRRPGDPEPFYRVHVFCCVNERPRDDPRGSCGTKGSEDLRNHMKLRAREMKLSRVRINRSGCLDRCALGPVMVIYPEGVWYSYATVEDVDEILERHVVMGERVERLLLHPEDRVRRGTDGGTVRDVREAGE